MKKSDRLIVFNKYGGRCAYCGCELQKGWHVDEILPVIRSERYVYGADGKRIRCPIKKEWKTEKYMEHPERLHIDNQNPACASCNMLKSSMSLESFRSIIAGFINSLNSYTNQYKFAKRYGLVTETNIPVIFYFETLKQ